MSANNPVDNDIYCKAIARRKNMSVDEYKQTLNKENPFADPDFLAEKEKTSSDEFNAAYPDVFEEH